MDRIPYVCEMHNIISEIGEIDVGEGLKIKQISKERLEIIDRSTSSQGRWQGFTPWFLEQEPRSSYPEYVDGDPSGAIRLFRIVSILFFGENVQFGPEVSIKKLEDGSLDGIVGWVRNTERFPMCRPDEYHITGDNIEELKTLFKRLIQGFKSPLLKIPLDRLVLAKSRRASPSDCIIDQSIALEALYGDPMAQRGAIFLGTSEQDVQYIYISLRSLYLARNQILHEGIDNPIIQLKDYTTQNSVQLRDWCFEHLRKAISRLLANSKYYAMDKSSFIHELRNSIKLHRSQFDSINTKYFPKSSTR